MQTCPVSTITLPWLLLSQTLCCGQLAHIEGVSTSAEAWRRASPGCSYRAHHRIVSWLEIQLLSTNIRMASYRVIGCRVATRSFQANTVCKGSDAFLPQISKFPGDFSSGSGGQRHETFHTREACLFDCEFLKDILKAALRAPTVSRSDLGQCKRGELIAGKLPFCMAVAWEGA